MAEDNAPRSISPARMVGLSDGVFSIAATLLVLEIALAAGDTALKQVLNTWPAYLGYLISFLTIGGAWLGHSAMTDRLDHVDSVLLRINLLLLLVIAFLPFPTKLMADGIHHSDEERVFVTFYGLTLLTIRLLGAALDAYARRENLYTTGAADDALIDDRRTLLPVVIAYAVVILVGLALPTVAVVLYLAVAVFLVVPFHTIRRMFSRQSTDPLRETRHR